MEEATELGTRDRLVGRGGEDFEDPRFEVEQTGVGGIRRVVDELEVGGGVGGESEM
jgi:hypothetical protein